jgi:putative sterol carrier protein
MEFDQILKAITERAENNPPLGSTVKFKLDDQVIFIDGRGDFNIVSDEDEKAACTISASQKTFAKMMRGELNPMLATMMGKMKISGDMGLAMKLQSFI